MPYKWTPPPGYTSLEVNGKTYEPGDMVPITKHDAEHMVKFAGHSFEGIDAPETPGPAGIPAQHQAPPKSE